jgi:hypothetical protein
MYARAAASNATAAAATAGRTTPSLRGLAAIKALDPEHPSTQGTVPTTVPPLVFILGVQKGGSSSLMWMAITHPQLCAGQRKETHFFGGNYEKLVEAGTKYKDIQKRYYGIFTDPKCTAFPDNTTFVDGTPVMHQAYWAAKNINEMYTRNGYADKLKFIVMLREPVSRDFSWYQHHMRQYLTGHKTGDGYSDDRKGSIAKIQTFKEMWASEIKAVKRGKKERSELPTDLGGDYVTQLQEFMKYFRRDQLFVMNSNHVFKETHDAMERIRQFLGLKEWGKWETDPFPHDDHLGSTNNSDDPECVFRHVPQMDCDFRDMLAAHYKDTNKVRSWPAVGRGGCSLLSSVLTCRALPCLLFPFPTVLLKALDDWMLETYMDSPPSEPAFESFGDSFTKIPCVEDARADLDAIIKKDTKDVC